ncbi:MAG: LysR family transcriptional regulator, partial [Alphaproteobacteria bacterium]
MELRQLQQFSVLTEALNFHCAADRSHIAQPPFSVSIRKLGEEWRVKLFNRSPPSVRLTEAGHAALIDARCALFHAAESERVAQATVSGTGGRLRIGFVGTAKYKLLPRLLPAFQAEYPDVTLALSERGNGEILRSLEGGELDIGIIRVPLATRSQVRSSLVERDSFMAALPADHRLANKRRLSMADLADELFVHYAATELHKMPPGLTIGLAVACASVNETS